MKSTSGSDRNMVLQQLFKCSLIVKSKGPHCKHLHKGPEFQSSYSALHYVANKSIRMCSGLSLLEISGSFRYKNLI